MEIDAVHLDDAVRTAIGTLEAYVAYKAVVEAMAKNDAIMVPGDSRPLARPSPPQPPTDGKISVIPT